ncbi:carboxypeptidase regulatory-like domain-containing protein, partial [Streptomyces sp. NPDC006129]|uniref:MSCRAMM family protein n=1 Tax=Streptomyces sp. NPDC006129 TaxID=3155348 RepID=UPI0033A51CBB
MIGLRARRAEQAPEAVPSATQAVSAATQAGDTTAQPLTATSPAATTLRAAEVPPSGGIPVDGHVLGAESAPVPWAAVTLISLGGRQLGRATAHQDGSYRLEAPGVGTYVLIASADGYQPRASTIVVGDEPVSFDFLLSGTSGLVGNVTSADSKEPVVEAMVIAADVRGEVLATGLTGADGAFDFAELVPGQVTLAVTAAGYRPAALPVEVGSPDFPHVTCGNGPNGDMFMNYMDYTDDAA